ncbi:hypothetical protein [Bosea sp. F3-2]|uniref:hypothetical protein n=1 Tax=Bosea sp. F3-2 TaxID=2599640 RepID=UPI001655F717|nr:hypothetical protein [Bosea sp. F3-2]
MLKTEISTSGETASSFLATAAVDIASLQTPDGSSYAVSRNGKVKGLFSISATSPTGRA